jgi:pyridoxine/pyridoxamine 5'-phosphate oxidase
VDVTDLDGDPLRQLSLWLDAARTAGQPIPEAMTIATATSDGVLSARLVVLRGLRRGLVFVTDEAPAHDDDHRPVDNGLVVLGEPLIVPDCMP